MSDMETIQSQAHLLSDARDRLTGVMQAMQRDVERIRAQYLGEIRQAARSVAAEHNKLASLIETNPRLFTTPRTQVVNGLKFGLQKKRAA